MIRSRLYFLLHLRNDFVAHHFAEFSLNQLPYLILLLITFVFSLCFGLPLLQLHDLLLNPGQQALAQLLLKNFLLLQKQGCNGFFDLLLDHLRHNLFDRFCNRLLNCYLEVLLGLNQLLQRIHLHVQVCKLLRKLLKVVNQQFLLAFAGLRHSHVDLRLLICTLW
jgi:hypothetical protein